LKSHWQASKFEQESLPDPDWLAVIGLALLAAWLSGCSQPAGGAPKSKDNTVPVTAALVVAHPQDRVLPVVGTLYPKDQAVVSAEVEGRIEKMLVEVGDRVAAGQELAQIDTASYQAQAQLAAANLAKAQANLANAESNWKRTQELRRDNISSASDLDLATAQAGQWRAEVKAQEAANAIAQLNLARSSVKAHFAAAVAERMVNSGDYVRAGAALLRVVNDAELKLVVQVPEGYAGQVQNQQMIRFNVYAHPHLTFTGQVYYVGPAVDTANRAFAAAAAVPNPDRRLKASSFARGELVLAQDVPTIMVPVVAVVNFAGVTKVFVVEDGIARSREIQTGRIREGRQEVQNGLRAGELVVVTGQTKLQDGSKVRVQVGAGSKPSAG
jgi:membrane fusion protein (multidrug efflux system)/multidrug efflux system membrane fusion protein